MASTFYRQCIFGSDCTSYNCTYVHPKDRIKPCKFGAECGDKNCTRPHPVTRKKKLMEREYCTFGADCGYIDCVKKHPKNRVVCSYGVHCKFGPGICNNGNHPPICKDGINCSNLQDIGHCKSFWHPFEIHKDIVNNANIASKEDRIIGKEKMKFLLKQNVFGEQNFDPDYKKYIEKLDKEYQNKIQHGTIFYSTLGKDGGSDERDNLIHALEMRQLNNETIKKYGMTYDEYCKHVTKYGKESNKLF